MSKHDFYVVDGCVDFIPVKDRTLTQSGIEVTIVGSAQKERVLVDKVYQINKNFEPKKLVVPKFVAEWIEKCKDINRSLRDAMKNTELSAELNAWFLKTGQDMFTYPNQETFARAWIDGYEVKQEKEYVVTDGNKLYLKEFDELNAVIIIDDVLGATDYAKRYSDKAEAQKAAAELGWKVVEVE